MWVLIDNYDSFTHILRDYLLRLHPEVRVLKNDAIDLEELKSIGPQRIVLSPGPRRPSDAGITTEAIRYFHELIPILGVCLGHQALAEFFGAEIRHAKVPMHGMTSTVICKGKGIFKGIPREISVMRYHSLVVEKWEGTAMESLALTESNELMAFRHRQFPSVGLQFHPESVLTEYGFKILENWARLY